MRKLNILPKLKPMIDMPFEDKYAITDTIIQRQIREHPGKLAVAWSGGKDSTIVLYLVLKYVPDVPVIFNNTGIEYPETIAFIRDMTKAWNLNLIETKPIKTFWECVEQYGFPKIKAGRTDGHDNRCCYYMKDKPALDMYRRLKVEAVLDGITAVENRNRQFHAIKRGTCYNTSHGNYIKSHTILYWIDTDVWNYATLNRIRMNDIYNKGADRCGCSCCTAFISWESQLSRLNPKLYALVKLRKDHQYVF